MKRYASLAAGLLLLIVGSAAQAEDAQPFITNKDVDLTMILPPPPANDSAQTKAELGEVLTLQVTRTPEMVASAVADAEENVWRFADVMGPKFNKETLPKFSAFFDRVVATEGAVVDPAKDVWKRPRPHQLSDLVKPAVKLSSSGSWPSGHATVGTMMGIILSDMVPEKRAEIMARASKYAHNRVVGGIHFASDVEMGRISGSVIAAVLLNRDDFKAEYEVARAELRSDLGM
ncbi:MULTISPECIES: phosphatase PAP2 family protein [unclassified Mesorhizobium]|jgi:acid phosphatase (class A)|uniref:acid phosphatase n=2 Tax=Mesorhizobium TaxID=68287 RepID=UPI000FCA880C|nr:MULTISPECIES: phosphatase PAP2 family protein [unclassified Mesorhizobium]AZV20516.1 phosphatase PAP2 family protein [Mesorhizobium sp. M7A.F.Ce.TU.012.03.2.1]RUU89621.1 phosphatase PAP2 family protein [Mesorhizobium sp. M7A.F.Ca.MR.176.00.0.0]RVD65539.1 phosphatase PAP2 family protein [Mesorhizobium sp. M7A.F.Ca.ET.027.03.2.1]RWP13722.1 MAG: phosphatase PAP2 family protein [Mesorhizobium sp.]RWP90442.1 MAG: phosphatase PAP2 family protein [Mesorhizobium sp.]